MKAWSVLGGSSLVLVGLFVGCANDDTVEFIGSGSGDGQPGTSSGNGTTTATGSSSAGGGSASDSCLNLSVECDDGNPCTEDSCDVLTDTCVAFVIDGVPAPDDEQIAGDCKVIACIDGVQSDVADNNDTPDDGLECTEDVCNGGIPVNSNVAIATPCNVGGGGLEKLCDGNGACVECLGPQDCAHLAPDNECASRSCDAGVCGQSFTAVDTPLAMQTAGDCQLQVCDGAGGVKSNAADADVPNDANACTDDLCTSGVPSNPPRGAGTPCGGTGECDGAGSCNVCDASSCGPDTGCRDYFCNGNSCEFTDMPFDTPCSDGGGNGCDGQGSCVACTRKQHCQGKLKCNLTTFTCE
jgi:hypothetical protein